MCSTAVTHPDLISRHFSRNDHQQINSSVSILLINGAQLYIFSSLLYFELYLNSILKNSDKMRASFVPHDLDALPVVDVAGGDHAANYITSGVLLSRATLVEDPINIQTVAYRALYSVISAVAFVKKYEHLTKISMLI